MIAICGEERTSARAHDRTIVLHGPLEQSKGGLLSAEHYALLRGVLTESLQEIAVDLADGYVINKPGNTDPSHLNLLKAGPRDATRRRRFGA